MLSDRQRYINVKKYDTDIKSYHRKNRIMIALLPAVRKLYIGQKHLLGLDVEMKGNRN